MQGRFAQKLCGIIGQAVPQLRKFQDSQAMRIFHAHCFIARVCAEVVRTTTMTSRKEAHIVRAIRSQNEGCVKVVWATAMCARREVRLHHKLAGR